MKHFFLTLLLIPSLLFAQEEAPNEPTETAIVKFDLRCEHELKYATHLMAGRTKGITIDQTLASMHWQWEKGNLRGYSEDIIKYMIDIVLIVYDAKDITSIEGAVDTIRKVEKQCIEYIPVPPKKPEPVSPKKTRT